MKNPKQFTQRKDNWLEAMVLNMLYLDTALTTLIDLYV